MSHICGDMSSQLNTVNTDLYTCGACNRKFNTICTLHQHITGHREGGAYHYDDVIKVAFPKSDYTCSSTQTDQVLTNFLQQLEFVRKYRLVSGDKSDVVTELDKGTVDSKRTKSFSKDLSNLKDFVEDEERDTDELKHYKTRHKGSSVKEKYGSVDRVPQPAVKKSVDIAYRNDTASVNESNFDPEGRTHDVRSCSVRLHRLSDKDMSFRDNKNNSLNVSLRKREHTLEDDSRVNSLEGKLLESTSKAREVNDVNDKDDGDDDNVDDDNFCSQPMEYVEDRLSQKEEKNENIKDRGFQIPMTMLEYRNTSRNVQVSKLRTDRTKLTHNDKQNKKMPTNESLYRNEIEFLPNENRRELNKNLNDKIDSDTEDEEGNLDTLHEKEYFYGKISAGDFVIQRNRPKGMFNRGEKNEQNKVFVEGTWVPVSEWTNETVVSCRPGDSDETEFSKIKEPYALDKNKNTFTKEGIKRFKRKQKYEQKPLLVCNICGKPFKHNCHLKDHMNVHVGLKPYMCQYCGKSYHKMTTMQTHQLHAHSDRSKWLSCQFCRGKSFPTAARLRAHEETHATEYKLICHECNKAYKSEKLLKDHVKYTHCKKRFRCSNCRQSFDSVEERDKHQKEKHDSFNKCRFCGRVFTSLRSKVRHEKIHLGVKTHECHICLRKFLQKTPFWVHMEKYHDLTKADLIQLFPEKHLDRNRQPLILEMQSKEGLDMKGTDDLHINDNE